MRECMEVYEEFFFSNMSLHPTLLKFPYFLNGFISNLCTKNVKCLYILLQGSKSFFRFQCSPPWNLGEMNLQLIIFFNLEKFGL
jgi:hypothetical protein